MSIGISPTACSRPAIFYDQNNNPLNIPCEGPRVCPVSLTLTPTTRNFIIDFTQLFTHGQMSALQSMSLDISNSSADNIIILCSGVNQVIEMTPKDPSNTNFFKGFVTIPLVVSNPPKFEIAFTGTVSGQLNLFFYNYMAPIFNTELYSLTPP